VKTKRTTTKTKASLEKASPRQVKASARIPAKRKKTSRVKVKTKKAPASKSPQVRKNGRRPVKSDLNGGKGSIRPTNGHPLIIVPRTKAPLIQDLDPNACSVSMRTSYENGTRIENYIPSKRAFRQLFVFEPGMFSGNLIFEQACRWLGQRGCQSAVVTLKGHGSGLKIANLGTLSIDDYAHDLHQFIKLQNSEVVLIGHSMGAIICNQVMNENRGQVRGFASLMGAPYRGSLPNLGWFRGALPSLSCISRVPGYLYQMVRGRPFKLSLRDAKALLFNRIQDPDKVAEAYQTLQEESGTAAWEILRGKYPFIPPQCKWLLMKAKYDNMAPHRPWTYWGIKRPWTVKVNTSHAFMYDSNWKEVPINLYKWFERSFPQA
jgi:pimeloyl-ACP methyl ester carboxylesterase